MKSLRFSGYRKRGGFTLVELLVSIAIIGMVTVIVLVKYKAFDSTVLLKNTAYDIALTLREAQVKSVSASYTNSTERKYPFGVTFSPNSKVYKVFRYASPTLFPKYDLAATPAATDIMSNTISRTMQVADVCITVDGTTWICNTTSGSPINRVDISFRKPEYKALFYAAKTTDGTNYSLSIKKARIKVNSTNGSANFFWVEVTELGQIIVYKG